MIICQILGGLGNQMFQYATGRALSLALGSPLLLDLRSFRRYSLHNGFEINRVFSAPVQVATDSDVSSLLSWREGQLIRKLLKRVRYPLLHGPHLVIEPHFNYWPRLRERDAMSYLMGYWQSEKYFKDFEPTIRADFRFKTALNGENLETAIRMQGCNSVSLHVRRGDYVTHASTAKILNICSIDYYHKAITYIAEQIPSPYFFVFSDDPQWAQNNLKIPFPVEYIDRNRGMQSYIDMQLMSLCKHHIIANSSFSWWGAWLNQNPGKLVIAPRNWFCNGINDGDLIPQDWTRL
jgi:Glycosyl transferase family 11